MACQRRTRSKYHICGSGHLDNGWGINALDTDFIKGSLELKPSFPIHRFDIAGAGDRDQLDRNAVAFQCI